MSEQYDFTAPFEGVVPHMYLDTKGLLTFGVGFRPPIEAYSWSPSLQAAQADAKLVTGLEPARPASFYREYCVARLNNIEGTFDAKMREYRAALQRAGWQLERHPTKVQIVICDMAWNLGVAGLGKFKRFRTHIADHDYYRASIECIRKGVQVQRNAASVRLLVECAEYC